MYNDHFALCARTTRVKIQNKKKIQLKNNLLFMTNSFHLFELVLIFIIVVFLKLNNVIATIVCALKY